MPSSSQNHSCCVADYLLKLFYCGKMLNKFPAFIFLVLMTLCVAVPPVSASTKSLASPDNGLSRSGEKILIISSDVNSGERLAKILQELYHAKVTVKTMDEYTPLIDEASYDGIVYFGRDYSKAPGRDFIHDIEKTGKPVLWINYHSWMLDKEYLQSKGLIIQDKHVSLYTEILMNEGYHLSKRDITLMKSAPDKVIYYLRSNSGNMTPGAIHIDNITFVSYAPDLDVLSSGFYPFLVAIRSVFDALPSGTGKKPLNYLERIAKARKDNFRTGVHLPVYVASSENAQIGYDSDKWHENLIRIKQSGAEWVNLVRTFYQTDIHSSDLHADKYLTPRLYTLKNIIHDAHALGLLVQLHIAVNLKVRGPNDWHGMIDPDDQKQWWAAYQSAVLETAAFSKRNEVEALVIGTEYTALQSDEQHWRTLIKNIKQQTHYPGMIGYAVNYNTLEISWLDALDFLGISAYWPLSEDRDPNIKTLNASWSRIEKRLDKWMARHPGLRVEFTEVGYASQPYASVYPFSWKPHKGQAQDLSEQLLCYQSLYHFLVNDPKIKGVHIFASTAADDDPNSIGYTPFGKPAEKVLRQIMHIR